MTVKIAISLPDETAAAVRRAVDAGDAPSVSAYIAAAIEEKAHDDTLAQFGADLLAELGRCDTEAQAWAEEAWRQADLAADEATGEAPGPPRA